MKTHTARGSRISLPPSLRFASVDFERQSQAEGLARTGFKRDQPAFFSWLGVSMYLSESAVMETLRFVAALPKGSEVVFDFIPASSSATTRRSPAARYVASLGEPWITFFDPPELVGRLEKTGFAGSTFLGPKEANERYFTGRPDGLRTVGAHLMAAVV